MWLTWTFSVSTIGVLGCVATFGSSTATGAGLGVGATAGSVGTTIDWAVSVVGAATSVVFSVVGVGSFVTAGAVSVGAVSGGTGCSGEVSWAL